MLGRRGVHDVAVRRALLEVDRALFTHDASAAAEDRPITDDEGHSVMAPGALAVLLEALALASGHRVLVLGSGGGYSAAVVARIAASVDVVEPSEAWASAALENLTRAGARRVRVLVGDLAAGGPSGELYDRVLVAGVVAEPPVQLVTQLAPRGLIVAAVGDRIHPDVVRITRGDGDTAPVASTLGKVELASRLGDVLVELRMASRASVEAAAGRGRELGKRLGEVLSSEGSLREHDLALALAAQRGLAAGSAERLLVDVDPAVSRVVSRAFLERHRVLPLRRIGERILVATSDPDAHVLDLQKALGAPTELVLVSPTDYRRLWAALDLRHVGERPRPFTSAAPVETDLLARHDLDARCVALFETLLLDAVGERASDVHLERYGDRVRVRLRVDGELRDISRMQWTPDDLVGVVNVIKVAAGLDIAERRLPQGGRIRRHAGAQIFDLRVQTQPSLHGEHIVVRLLPQEQRLLTVEDLGFAPDVAASYRRMLDSPAGLVLVVGPTGSGKTTTLYAGLQILARDATRKVLTIEDPIEYSIDLVQQSQARGEIGFSFASAMRAFVREDPDVILVGEIRDAETALEAIRASQTGHVVLSTLHCNDATDAVQRLLDLGMHPNSIASELLAVFAQRLARRICPACRREAVPEKEILAELFPRGAPAGFACFVGAGCDRCGGHGTLGRIAVVEHLRTGAAVRRAIARREPLDDLRKLAMGQGLSTMRVAALDLVRRGVIALREIPWILSAERMAEEPEP
jgi:type IV pilus assembly protein PilB